LNFVQVKCLKWIFRRREIGLTHKNRTLGDISNFASLCTALSATLGTGNIVGIAVAVSVGGPGTLFWLALSSFFSLALKYCEGFLSIRYRQIGSDGKIAGGPMYYIEQGLHSKFLAKLFAFFGTCVALIGIGTLVQTNSIAAAASSLGISNFITAIILGIIVGVIIFGGIHRIAEVAKKVVPAMTVFYIVAAIWILISRVGMILPALKLIITDAFHPQAFVGGGCGIALIHVIQTGISRGIFCHESGLGSAAIASAAAKVDNGYEQGMISMIGAFMSIIVCVITGLVLIVTADETHLFSSTCEIPTTLLTAYAFGNGLGILALGFHVVNISILFFAFTTIIGWNYYGEKCVQYLISTKAIPYYRMLFLFFVVIGPFLRIKTAFVIADIVIGLMAIPNIISLIMLRKEIVKGTV
ncbi:MAG: amino acid carrier protein, partial [Opitutales bacterium]|nr:amino acid carrier protein [Opitutales bacterium]